MDELLEMFNTFIGEALDHERAMDAEFMELEKKLSECVTMAKERGTPVQNKKRPKRQASLSEKEEDTSKTQGMEEETSEATTSATAKRLTGDSTTVRSSSARMLDVNGKGEGEKAPQPLNSTASGDNSLANESSVRPSRTARLKAQEKLKEPQLGGKLRNDGGVAVTIKIERNSTIANSSTVVRGKEKIGHERTYVEMETENDANQANKIISPASTKADKQRNDEGFSSATEMPKAVDPPANEREQSLLVIPPIVPKVEIVSDEEMPPPSLMLPPKLPAPKVRTKKKVPATGGKSQKDGNETASSSAVSSADSTMNSTASSIASIASSNSSGSNGTSSGRVGRPKKQPPKQVNEMAVPDTKTSAPVPMELDVVIEPIRIKTEKMSIVQSASDRTSDKSTYEDAQEQQNYSSTDKETTAQLEKQMRPLRIALQKIPVSEMPLAAGTRVNLPSDLNGTYTTQTGPSDGTFVMPAGSVQNGTFTVKSPMEQTAGVGAICNETFNIPSGGGTPTGQPGTRPDETFVIEKNGGAASGGGGGSGSGSAAGDDGNQRPLANASIMTEDESVVENSPIQPPLEQVKSKPTPRAKGVVAPPVPGPKPQKSTSGALKKTTSSVSAAEAKKNKELFNPCVMSPIKSRIEAFEKCATTGTTASKIGTPQAQIGRLLKTVSTPTLGTSDHPHGLVRSAHAKPLPYTPTCTAQQPAPKASSASKIGQMQSRALHHGTAANGGAQLTRSQTRDSSWDRTGGGSGGTLSSASSTSSLLDEKKKKREEKQRLATAQREAMEREKREHAERLVREKEEKYRKLVQEKQEKMRIDAQKKARKLEEFEKRRQAEEQKALADQKRDELAKHMADQERINRELLDTLKQQNQTKENHETKLHKQLYQQKLRQQQQQLEKQHHQQQLAEKKKQAAAAAKNKAFTFEMIDTDDSTDDEEDTSAQRKKQRPPLPEWCQKTADFRKQLKLQAQIQTVVIDRLFSVQPMTPDLRLLFPSIDAQKLKRNSSAIWRTPPRHSQLP